MIMVILIRTMDFARGELLMYLCIICRKRFGCFSLFISEFIIPGLYNYSLNNIKHYIGAHDRTSAIAYKGKCHTGKRDELDPAAHRKKHLENIHDTDAVYDDLIELITDPV